MSDGQINSANAETISYSDMMTGYASAQNAISTMMSSAMAGGQSGMNPSTFMNLQFQMQQVSQVGESISQIFSQLAAITSQSVRNFKSG